MNSSTISTNSSNIDVVVTAVAVVLITLVTVPWATCLFQKKESLFSNSSSSTVV